MLTKLMKNTKCSQVNKVLMVIFGIWSVLNVFQIRHHASNVLESWKMVDCSYHRVLQFLHKGAPDSDWPHGYGLESLPKSSLENGWFGLNGFEYFLDTIKENFNKIDRLIDDQSELRTKVQKIRSDFQKMTNLDSDRFKIDSCTSPGSQVHSNAIYELTPDFNLTNFLYSYNWLSPHVSINRGTKIAKKILKMEELMDDYKFMQNTTNEFNDPNWFYYTASIVTYKNFLLNNIKGNLRAKFIFLSVLNKVS